MNLLFAVVVGVLAQAPPTPSEELVLVRLKYTVDSEVPRQSTDWNAKGFGKVLYNLSEALNRATSAEAAKAPKVLTLEDPQVFAYPFLFMAGHYGVRLNEKEVVNLREHLTKGGFLLATACCGNDRFTTAFEREMKRVFPDGELKLLPPEHPVYDVFYEIKEVKCFFGADQKNQTTERSPLRGIDIDGRTVVIYSPYALTCGWTRRGQCIASCRRIETENAFEIGVNVIIYALTH